MNTEPLDLRPQSDYEKQVRADQQAYSRNGCVLAIVYLLGLASVAVWLYLRYV